MALNIDDMPIEARIELALDRLKGDRAPNYAKTANFFKIDRSTLSRRHRGKTTSRKQFLSDTKQALSSDQEEVLISQINKLTQRSIPPTSRIVRNLAEEILGREVGKNWTSNFVKRHSKRLKSRYLRCIDNLRVKADNVAMFDYFYDLLIKVTIKYDIQSKHIYNWDEKGFMIGMGRTMKRIMSASAYNRGRVMKARQDGSREFITLLAAICADGTALPPALIYKGDSGDLQDSWVQDVGEKDKAYFGASSNGWSSNAFGLYWLINVFDPAIRRKAGGKYRLLIVDGHSSHVNMEFLSKCDELKIIVLILPPHSMHRLQPLDVGTFGPLATNYSTLLNDLMHNSGGIVGMTKRMFWGLFKEAWELTCTRHNILRSFEKTGIYPMNRDLTIDSIAPEAPLTPPTSFRTRRDALATPYTSKAMRRMKLEFRRAPTHEITLKLFKAATTLGAEAAIQGHRAKGLEQSLKLEKRKRARSKCLNLIGEEGGGAFLWSPSAIIKAKVYQEDKVLKEEQEREAKLQLKAEKKAEKK